MPSYGTHETLTFPLLLLIVWGIAGTSLVFIFAVGVVVGQIWLNPDLDTHSTPFQRWWIFKVIWIPYQKLVGHRSWVSHWPIAGTTVRLAYLAALPSLVLVLLRLRGIDVFPPIVEWMYEWGAWVAVGVLGLEVSSTFHWITDHLL